MLTRVRYWVARPVRFGLALFGACVWGCADDPTAPYSEPPLSIRTDSTSYLLGFRRPSVAVHVSNLAADTVFLAACHGAIQPGLEQLQPSGAWPAMSQYGCVHNNAFVDSEPVPIPPGDTFTVEIRFLVIGTFRVRVPLFAGDRSRFSESVSAPFSIR